MEDFGNFSADLRLADNLLKSCRKFFISFIYLLGILQPFTNQ
jgi:hypothetical protein